MKFIVVDEIRKAGIPVCGVLINGASNRLSDDAFEAYKNKITAKIKDMYTPESIKEDPVLKGFRELHESFGVSNRKNRSAPENLLEFVLKRGSLPQVNLLVDIYNLVSVQSKLALGAHDADHIGGNVTLRLTDGTEHFHPISYPDAKPVAAHEYSYIDDDNEVICRLEVRQCEKTKVTPETKNLFYIVQGNRHTSENDLRTAVAQLIDLTEEFCGGYAEVI